MTDHKALLPYAKEGAQTETLKACIREGSNNRAAKALGKHSTYIYDLAPPNQQPDISL